MILQKDLRTIRKMEHAVAKLEKSEPVTEYLQTKKARDAALAAIRQRVRDGEKVEPGALALKVKTAVTVSWEKVLTQLRNMPAVTKFLARCQEAQEFLTRADTKPESADYTELRYTVEIVEA